MSEQRNDIDRSGPIVVGVDGSKPSRDALKWAAQQAALAKVPLRIVTTWTYPTGYGYAVVWPENIDIAADAKAELQSAIDDVLGTDAGIDFTAVVVEGHPALTLVEESKTARLLVVGSRGHGEFVGMLLGSVSEFISTHAHCPVVIIRGDGDEGK